jgi:glutathione S-transferase
MGKAMLTFYFDPGASSMAVHIGLHEVGAEFDARPISLAKGENRTSDYLAINPSGKVPTLLVDGRPLTEVAAILFYLARRFPDAGLMPPDDDIEGQAQVISWMSFVASGIHPIWSKGLDVATPVYRVADRKLGSRDWVVGTYSIADIHLFRLVWRFVNKYKPEPGAFPNLERHYARMMERPAVRQTIAVESSIGYNLP